MTDKSISAYDNNERVRRYDADMDLLHPNRHKMVEIALEVLPLDPAAPLRALDLGIGTGFFTQRFLEKYPRATVIGVDGSDAMIQLARARLEDSLGQVRLVTTRFEDLQTVIPADQKLDVVFSSYALHHLYAGTKSHVLNVAVDRLNGGAWLMNVDLVSCPHPEIEKIIQDIRVKGIERRNQNSDARFANADRIRAFLDNLENTEGDQPLTLQEDVELLSRCGIQNATVFWKEYRDVVYGGCKGG